MLSMLERTEEGPKSAQVNFCIKEPLLIATITPSF